MTRGLVVLLAFARYDPHAKIKKRHRNNAGPRNNRDMLFTPCV